MARTTTAKTKTTDEGPAYAKARTNKAGTLARKMAATAEARQRALDAAEASTEPIDFSDIPEVDFTKARIIRRGPKDPRGMLYTLALVRKGQGKTQADVAAAAGMRQDEVLKLEARADTKVSTLRRYATALGLELDIVLVSPLGHRFRIELE